MATFGDITVRNFKVSQVSDFFGEAYFRRAVTFRDLVTFRHNAETSGECQYDKNMEYTDINPCIIWSNDKKDEPVKIMYNYLDEYRPPAGLKVVGDPKKNSSPAWFEVEGDIIIGGALQQRNGDIYTDHRFLSNNKNENKAKDPSNSEKIDPQFNGHYPAFEVRGSDSWDSIIWEVNNAPDIPDSQIADFEKIKSEYEKEMLKCNWASQNGYYEMYKKGSHNLQLWSSKTNNRQDDLLVREITPEGDITIGKYFPEEEENPKRYGNLNVGNEIRAYKVYNAVWNDLTDLIDVPEDTKLEYGKCYIFDGKKYFPSKHYGQKGIIGIHSDTSGLSMGLKPNKTQLSIAVAGFVLAYVDKDYPPGTPLTCSKDGSLTKLKKIDKILSPESIVGTFYKPELKEKWYGIKVNGRKWIKIL